MARAQDQARWRQKNERKRIEIYLPVDVVDRLDAFAKEQGQSRAQVLAALVDAAAPAAHDEAADSTPARCPDTVDFVEQTGSQEGEGEPPVPPAVRWRRVRSTGGWDALDIKTGAAVAYVTRDNDAWQAEGMGERRGVTGHGSTRQDAFDDLYR